MMAVAVAAVLFAVTISPAASVNDNTALGAASAEGDIEWAKNIGGTGADYLYSVTTVPGGTVAVGSFASLTIDYVDKDGVSRSVSRIGSSATAIVVKYDKDGNIEWAKNFGGTGFDYLYSVSATSDGFVAAGTSSSATIDYIDKDGANQTLSRIGSSNTAFIVKYDNDGNIEWAKNFGGTGTDTFRSISTTSDGIAVAGDSNSLAINYVDKGGVSRTLDRIGSNYTAMVVKYDNDGNIEWAKNFGGANSDYFYGVTATSDGGIAAVGNTGSPTINYVDKAGASKTLTWISGGTTAIIVVR